MANLMLGIVIAILLPQCAVGETMEEHVRNLSSKDTGLRMEAVAALTSSPALAITPLLGGLSHDDPLVRERSARILGELRNPRARIPLEKSMLSDSSWLVRGEAIYALRTYLKAKESAPALIRSAASDSRALNRMSAIEGLSTILKKDSIPHIREHINDSDGRVRMVVLRELAANGDTRDFQAAMDGMKDSSARVREQAALALWAMEKPESLALLREHADNPKETVGMRDRCIRAASHIELSQRPKSEWPALLRKAMTDSRESIRDWAAYELRKLGTKEGLDILREIASDRGHPGNQLAIAALRIRAQEDGD